MTFLVIEMGILLLVQKKCQDENVKMKSVEEKVSVLLWIIMTMAGRVFYLLFLI